MYGYIYETKNKVNGKRYIGQRKGEFTPKYLGSGLHLRSSINKYGVSKFEVKVIASAENREKLNQLEMKFIAEYRKIFSSKLYNITAGGMGVRRPVKEEIKRRISKTMKGKLIHPMTNSIRKKISKTLMGHIPWNKGKHPKYVQGKNHPMYGTHHIAWNKGKHIFLGGGFKKGYKQTKSHTDNIRKSIKQWWKIRKGGY